MCGIAGILRYGEDASPRVAAMLDAMRHRGPDGRGETTFQDGAAGMVRLALVDLSPRGQQPLWSGDRRVAIIFNGEIYNFRELKRSLEGEGYSFGTGTDSEVVLAQFLRDGPSFVHALRGMYALALFDFRRRGTGAAPDLLLARGPFGMKPLYVSEPSGSAGPLLFASELKGMLASGLVPRELDSVAVQDFLRYGFVLQPRTMLRHVRMLEPGALEEHRVGEPTRVTRIASWSTPRPRNETEREAGERLRSVLDESIRIHSLADAPVGAFLSGGLDSSTIAALMVRAGTNLKAYTLSCTDVPGSDEVAEAAAAARHIGCELTVVAVSGREVREIFPRFVRDLDQPSIDGLNTWLISRGAAADVKAVLSGLGGDELFGGYPTTRRMLFADATLAGRVQARVAARIGKVPHALPARLAARLENFAQRASPLRLWIQGHKVFSWEDAGRLAGVEKRATIEDGGCLATLETDVPGWRTLGVLDLAAALDARMYMTNQLLRDSDATSMAHSLELRCPFVDREVAGFAATCERQYNVTLHGPLPRQKRLLALAMKGAVPEEVLTRPKQGFIVPYAHWLRRELQEPALDLTADSVVRRRGLLDPDMVARARADATARVADSVFPKLWALTMLEAWCSSVLDAPGSALGRSREQRFDDVARGATA